MWAAGWAMVVGLVFGAVTALTLALWATDSDYAQTTPVTDLSFLALGGLISAGFTSQALPRPSPTGARQALLAAVALAASGLAGQRIEPSVGGLILVVVAVTLRAVRRRPQRLSRPRGPASRGLGALAVVASLGGIVYAVRMLGLASEAGESCFLGRCAHGDRLAEMAATAVAVAAVAVLAALRAEGRRLPVWSAGAAAAMVGAISFVMPAAEGSLGRMGGVAALVWGGLFIAVGEIERTADGRRSPASLSSEDRGHLGGGPMRSNTLMPLTIAFCCGVVTISTAAWAPVVAAVTGGPSTSGDTFSDADAYLRERADRLNVPGATLAVVTGDRPARVHGVGAARPGGAVPTATTPFGIGSLTKSFTALAVMQLVESGRVVLDAPVITYLPWFRLADREAAERITVRQLLNQTSGLPQMPGMVLLADFDAGTDATERQVRQLATLSLDRPPGTAFEYSNLNYNVLGLVIEVTSGETYPDYLQRHIFDPLQMRHTYTSLEAARRDGLAAGHRFWFGFPLAVANPRTPAGSLPSGQIISSAGDLAHYLAAHLHGGRYQDQRVLSAAGMAELHRPAVEATAMGISLGYYAMGWFVEDQGGTPLLTHDGIMPDYFAYMAVLPEQDTAMVLLSNANHVMMEKTALLEWGAGLAAVLAGKTPPEPAYDLVPWMLRGLLLIPVAQAVGVALTLRRLRIWRRTPARRSRFTTWLVHLVLPLAANLVLAAVPVAILATGLWPFLLLYLPDVAWITICCGAFAAVWAGVRSWLVGRALI
jgi:CubicO group peptidase (beta-lactamase class C family)